jgi:hemerythrin-like metal-binding protein
MSVGVPALDTDHRCLIRIINLLREVEGHDLGRMVETVLDTLHLYARYHFAREERLMEACGFPALAEHRAEHKNFAQTIAMLRLQYRGKGSRRAAGQLLDYLKGWLRQHILVEDMAYKRHLSTCAQADAIARGAASAALHLSMPPPPHRPHGFDRAD